MTQLPHSHVTAGLSSAPATCRVCSSRGECDLLHAREQMFGMGAEFTYAVCRSCGSLSLLNPPQDFSPYYPPGYYSYTRSNRYSAKSRWLAQIFRWLPDPLLKWLAPHVYAAAEIVEARQSVSRFLGSRPAAARILDVGCGSGFALMKFHHAGFRAEGCDPFYTGADPEEFKIHRIPLSKVSAQYDIITFNHALEHVADPRTELQAAAALLSRGGVCVVAIPKLPSAAFDLYGADWFSLDAPRHCFIPSVDGLRRLGSQVGLTLASVIEEPVASNHLWSEVYRRGQRFDGKQLSDVLSPGEIRALSDRAAELSAPDRGCHATFIFRKP